MGLGSKDICRLRKAMCKIPRNIESVEVFINIKLPSQVFNPSDHPAADIIKDGCQEEQ